MVKEKYKKALKKSKQLEKKKIRSLKQLGKSETKFKKGQGILKRSIGRLFKRKRKK